MGTVADDAGPTPPSAGAGALALLLLKTEFSPVALLGLFLLIGVVMKNAILMIDVALQRERETGATPESAIREACLLRLRPILLTTMLRCSADAGHGRRRRTAAAGADAGIPSGTCERLRAGRHHRLRQWL